MTGYLGSSNLRQKCRFQNSESSDLAKKSSSSFLHEETFFHNRQNIEYLLS